MLNTTVVPPTHYPKRGQHERCVYGRLHFRHFYSHSDSFWLVSFPNRKVFDDCKRVVEARRLLGGAYHCRLERMAAKDANREELTMARQCHHYEPASMIALIEWLERDWNGTPQQSPVYYLL